MKELTLEQLSALWKLSGYLSKTKFYKYIKDKLPDAMQDVKITQKSINEFLDKQETTQIVAKTDKEKYSRTITSDEPRSDYQIDIMVYNRNPRRGYKYIIGCIDVYSRYAMCVALKSREQKGDDSEVMTALKLIFKTMGIPKNINCDNEFISKAFNEYCKEHNIKIWLSYADDAVIDSKNSIIERFWKTLAQKIRDYRNNTGEGDWTIQLNDIVTNYNNTYHETIRGEPEKIFNGKEPNKQDIIILPMKYKIGDVVRIRNTKDGTFTKGDIETFSRDTYTIIGKDMERKNRWIVKNTETNEELVRSYLERDFSKVNEVIKPSVEVQTRVHKDVIVKKDELIKERVKKELKELKIDATTKMTAPKTNKREKKEPKKLNL